MSKEERFERLMKRLENLTPTEKKAFLAFARGNHPYAKLKAKMTTQRG